MRDSERHPGTLRFRWADPGDLPAIESFLSRHYGPGSVQAAAGRATWLYLDNPLGLHVSIAEDAGAMVAVCGHLPWPFASSRARTVASFGIDMMVAKGWRRMGIGSQFLKMRLQRFPLSLSAGQSDKMASLYRRHNAIDLGPLVLARWRCGPPRDARPRVLLRDGLIWSYCTYRKLCGSRLPAHRDPWTWEQAIAWLRRFWGVEQGQLSADDRVSWFSWRYSGPVYRDYRVWSLESADRRGLLVTRKELGVEWIIDLYGPRSRVSEMLTAAARTSDAAEVRVIAAGNQRTSHLRNAGYFVRPMDARMVAVSVPGHALDDQEIQIFAGASDVDLMRRPVS